MLRCDVVVMKGRGGRWEVVGVYRKDICTGNRFQGNERRGPQNGHWE